MAQNYYEKQQSRIDYYETKLRELKEQHQHLSTSYSYKTIERVSQIEKSIKYYEEKIEGIKNNSAISSDNPDAIDTLEAKLENLKAKQIRIKEYNKKLKEYCKKGDKVDLSTLSKIEMENIKAKVSYQHYVLPYLSRDIRNLTKRIEKLKKLASAKTKEYEFDGFKVIDNVEENRVQIFVDKETGKAFRDKFRNFGFVFSFRNQAWQRKRGNAVYAAKNMIKILKEHFGDLKQGAA